MTIFKNTQKIEILFSLFIKAAGKETINKNFINAIKNNFKAYAHKEND